MLAPWLVLTAIFVLWPLGASFSLSLQQTFGPEHAVYVGADNYRRLLHDGDFLLALRNTALFTVLNIIVQIPLALGLALLLNRPDLRGRGLWRLVFFSPALAGFVFVAVLFGALFESRDGLINLTLRTLWPAFPGEFAWLEDHVMSALVLANLWMFTGLNMIYFLAALQSVDQELLEASRIDGAGPWARFRHVILPSIRPVSGFVLLLAITGSLQLFELPWVLLGGSGPEKQGLTLVMHLYQCAFEQNDLGYGSALGWVLALILGAGAMLQVRWQRETGPQ